MIKTYRCIRCEKIFQQDDYNRGNTFCTPCLYDTLAGDWDNLGEVVNTYLDVQTIRDFYRLREEMKRLYE